NYSDAEDINIELSNSDICSSLNRKQFQLQLVFRRKIKRTYSFSRSDSNSSNPNQDE
ncbi:12388_t:CDS:1, partial [Funneliformis mosseae]